MRSEVTGLSAEDIDWYEDFIALKLCCLLVSTAKILGVEPPDQRSLARRLNLSIAD